MKLIPLRNKIERFIEVQKHVNERNFLNKYVNIRDTSINDDAYCQMFKARKGIANYLADKALTVDIYDAKNIAGAGEQAGTAESLTDKIKVVVTDLLFNKETSRVLSANTDEVTIHKVPDYIIVEHFEDGLQQTRLTSHEYEDSFLRNLYRNISEMANSLRPEK